MKKVKFLLFCVFILAWLSAFWFFTFMSIFGYGKQQTIGVIGFVIALIVMIVVSSIRYDREE